MSFEPLDRVGKIAAALNPPAIAVMFLFSYLTYPRLPDPYPIHFNFAGQPDGWSARTPISWYIFPLSLLAFFLLIEVILLGSRWFGLKPKYINLPRRMKKKLLSLPPDIAGEILAPITALCRIIVFETIIFTAYLQYSVYQVAVGEAEALSMWTAMITYYAALIYVIYYGYRVTREWLDGALQSEDAPIG